jgi:hypothetical protein
MIKLYKSRSASEKKNDMSKELIFKTRKQKLVSANVKEAKSIPHKNQGNI